MKIKKKLIDTWETISSEGRKENNKTFRVILNHKYLIVRACLLERLKTKSVEFIYDKSSYSSKQLNDIDTKGLEIKFFSDHENKKNNIISIKLKNIDFFEIYLEFLENIIENINSSDNKKTIVQLIIKKINIWIKFFKKEKFDGLSEEEIRGLIGELLFIKNFSNKKADFKNNILKWKGCENGLHDFETIRSKIEIKTFSSEGIIRISYPDQLDINKYKNIFFICYSLQKEGGVFSLNDIVKEIQEKLDKDFSFIFLDKLKSYGYFEAHKGKYNDKYKNIKIYYYQITKDFPKILQGDLHNSIKKIRFGLDTNLLSSYDIGKDKIQKFLIDENDKNR